MEKSERVSVYKSRSVGYSRMFYVEKLIDRAVLNDLKYYHVKWLNWPASENSWEPETNLKQFCQPLMDAYDHQLYMKNAVKAGIEGDNIKENENPQLSVFVKFPSEQLKRQTTRDEAQQEDASKIVAVTTHKCAESRKVYVQLKNGSYEVVHWQDVMQNWPEMIAEFYEKQAEP